MDSELRREEIGTVTGVDVSAGALMRTSGKIPLFFQQFRIVVVSTSYHAASARRMASNWSIS